MMSGEAVSATNYVTYREEGHSATICQLLAHLHQSIPVMITYFIKVAMYTPATVLFLNICTVKQ